MAYDQQLADANKELARAKAAINSAYAYCEGAGGHYKDALEAITATLGDYLWPMAPCAKCGERTFIQIGAQTLCPTHRPSASEAGGDA